MMNSIFARLRVQLQNGNPDLPARFVFDPASLTEEACLKKDTFYPALKLSTTRELVEWTRRYPNFLNLWELRGRPVQDCLNADLKLIQDLAMVDFLARNLRPGARILEVGGGTSRVLSYFQHHFECWNLDKFEGIGNGLTYIPKYTPYKLVLGYIGDFCQDLPNAYFDCVFSISVFEHIKGDANSLRAITDDMARLLQGGGLQAHCMDCRFPPKGSLNLPGQSPLVNHILERHGFTAQYIYDHYQNRDVWTMSAEYYDRYWKRACGNAHEDEGMPFNIFIADRA